MSALHANLNKAAPTEAAPIAVIGAGIAGLACAELLAQAGQRVHVFDKSRGPAGRMSTKRGEDGVDAQGAGTAWQCDQGAQYFTARDADFHAQVQRWVQAGAAALWPGRIASYSSSHSASGFVPSSTALARYVGTPRMTAPAHYLMRMLGDLSAPAMPVQFHLQSTVQTLEAQDGAWQLRTLEAGVQPQIQPHHYRTVLLAMPAPQALALLNPVAPDGAALAASATMRGCWAVMLRCSAAVNLSFDGAFIDGGPLSWIARDSSKPGRTGPETWLLHASAEWSEAHIEDDAAKVCAALLQAFAALGGPDPASVQATAHRWRYADSAPALTAGCWWSADARLGACGDWLNGGKVEGAWLSGRALARSALAALAAKQNN